MTNVTKANLKAAKQQYLNAKEAYYNKKRSIMTDAEFDALEDGIRAIDPKWSELKKTGVATKHKKEVEHEYFMPSLSKAYPEDMPKFLKKYAAAWYVVMAKLDGTSLALTYKKGKPSRLVTRGDGVIGGDVSHLIPHLVRHGLIPESFRSSRDVTLRLEGVMRKGAFEKRWSAKYDNARNLVNGIFNKQTEHPALCDVDLLVLGVFGMGVEEGLSWASEMGFDVVPYIVERLGFVSNLSMKWARDTWSVYDIDGVVVAPKQFHYEYENADKPKGIWAYKENDLSGAAEVVIERLDWQKARTGRWTPVIYIVPTRMDGVTVKKATCHNAKWMEERCLGPGAIVKVLRSGGVIPKIVDVVKGVKPKQMVWPDGDWDWDGVHIVDQENSAEEDIAAIRFFLTTMGVEFLAEGGIKKLYEAGHVKNVADLVKLADEHRMPLWFKDVLGVGMAKKVFASLKEKMEHPKLKTLMVASGRMQVGIGERQLTKLEQHGLGLGTALRMQESKLKKELLNIAGIQEKTADKIVTSMAAFEAWYEEAEQYLPNVDMTIAKPKKAVQGVLAGKKIAWTGYRDKDQEAAVEAAGGEVVKYGASMTHLLYNPSGKFLEKVEKAGSKAIVWKDFAKKFSLRS